MFGSKQTKRERLARIQEILREREVNTASLARELGVSRFTIMDDLISLEDQGVKVCEHEGKLSLLERWFGKK